MSIILVLQRLWDTETSMTVPLAQTEILFIYMSHYHISAVEEIALPWPVETWRSLQKGHFLLALRQSRKSLERINHKARSYSDIFPSRFTFQINYLFCASSSAASIHPTSTSPVCDTQLTPSKLFFTDVKVSSPTVDKAKITDSSQVTAFKMDKTGCNESHQR